MQPAVGIRAIWTGFDSTHQARHPTSDTSETATKTGPPWKNAVVSAFGMGVVVNRVFENRKVCVRPEASLRTHYQSLLAQNLPSRPRPPWFRLCRAGGWHPIRSCGVCVGIQQEKPTGLPMSARNGSAVIFM